jgi:hypothetical protein
MTAHRGRATVARLVLLAALLGWPVDVSAETSTPTEAPSSVLLDGVPPVGEDWEQWGLGSSVSVGRSGAWPLRVGTQPIESAVAPEPSPRYLLIHLDGVGADVLSDELDAGNLPNLQAFFGQDGIIRHGVTFYPPFTSNVVLRLRHGIGMEEGEILDWGAYDPDDEVQRGRAGVFMEYASTVPRRTRSNFIHGFPVLDHLAGFSLWNVPEKLDAYGVVEFYWFGTDTAGHVWGEEALRENLRRFDRYFGGLASNLDDDVHVVVYADHGMVYGEVEHYDLEVEHFLEGRIRHYAYPNIYLKDGEDPDQVARELVRETWQDLAFYQAEPGWIVGYDAGGRQLHFQAAFTEGEVDGEAGGEPGGEGLLEAGRGLGDWRSSDGLQPRVRYWFEGPGPDPLGYWEIGYQGEALTSDQWLELTHDQDYPYTPIRILELFSNPRAGDVVTVLNDKPKAGPWIYSGNHHGLNRNDMSVPVLVRGEELSHLYGRDHVRLENLLSRASIESFESRDPSRERHEVVGWVLDDVTGARAAGEAFLSPRYRLRLGIRAESAWGMEGTEGELWGSWDLVSGFLSRLWVGAGVHRGPEVEGTRALLRLDHELRVRRLGAIIRLSTAQSARLDFFVRLHDHADLKLRNLEGMGLRVRF